MNSDGPANGNKSVAHLTQIADSPLTLAASFQLIAGQLQAIEAHLSRLANHFDPPPPDIVDTPFLARQLGVTPTRIAQMVREGTIPKSCIVPGTGDGRPWKFYRHRLDEWLARR
jgi:hypothetical protein